MKIKLEYEDLVAVVSANASDAGLVGVQLGDLQVDMSVEQALRLMRELAADDEIADASGSHMIPNVNLLELWEQVCSDHGQCGDAWYDCPAMDAILVVVDWLGSLDPIREKIEADRQARELLKRGGQADPARRLILPAASQSEERLDQERIR